MPSAQSALSKLRENKIIYLRPVGEAEWDNSRVESVLGEFLQVAHPLKKGRLRTILSKENFEIGFSAGGDFFTFLSAVLEVKRSPLPLLVLERPTESELVQVQRRKSPRVNSLIPLAYEIRGGNGLVSLKHTLALDLSATGLAFNAPHPLSPGGELKMEIQVPNAPGSLSAKGEVVSCARVLNSREERYKVRLKFTAVSQIAKSRIQEFVQLKRENQKKLE